ncbi:MAG TPA: MFS transporter, partial [Actinomycetota bacterium]
TRAATGRDPGVRMQAVEERLGRGTWLALVAMGLGVFVIANDFTALSVAIPNIEKDLHTTLNKAQWVINGYALVFGVLIVTGGRLADLFGRKRTFMVGAAVFAVFSLLAGLMPSVWPLIVCRGLMGVGGALIWPAILGMTYALLPDSKAGLAGGLILGVAGLGNAVGPMLGGVLTDELSWRWVFFLNLPITLFAMLVTWREVPEATAGGGERRIDAAGIVVLTTAIVAILVALDQGADTGFGDPLIVGLVVAGVALLGCFLLVERRQGGAALVPRDALRNRVFAASCGAVLLLSAIFFAVLLYLPQFMEKVLGWSALRAGVGLLPLMGVFAATSFVAGSLYGRLGARVVVSAGAACLGIGMLLLSFLDRSSSYLPLVPGMVVVGLGVGLFYSSITTTAVTALDPSRASLAGGIVYMCQIAGGAVGLGLNTAIVSASARLARGIHVAFLVDAALALAGLLVILAFIGRPTTHPHPHPLALRERHRAHA